MGKKKRAKERARGKRKQKAALKARQRTAALKRSQPPSRARIIQQQFPDEDWVFWIAHGVNYLVSDYGEGIWKPLFEGIYEGHLPTPEEVARTILEKFGTETGEEGMSLEGKTALAWSVQAREGIYVYYREALRRLQEKDPAADAENLANLKNTL